MPTLTPNAFLTLPKPLKLLVLIHAPRQLEHQRRSWLGSGTIGTVLQVAQAEEGRGGRTPHMSLAGPAPEETWQTRREHGQACDV